MYPKTDFKKEMIKKMVFFKFVVKTSEHYKLLWPTEVIGTFVSWLVISPAEVK